jgi:hypothetical protein
MSMRRDGPGYDGSGTFLAEPGSRSCCQDSGSTRHCSRRWSGDESVLMSCSESPGAPAMDQQSQMLRKGSDRLPPPLIRHCPRALNIHRIVFREARAEVSRSVTAGLHISSNHLRTPLRSAFCYFDDNHHHQCQATHQSIMHHGATPHIPMVW